jgi:alanine racemase
MMVRPTRVEVDLGAVEANVRLLRAQAGGAQFCAVVKADGYGHGAVPVAFAAKRGGAEWLAVALVEEVAQLRRAGVTGPVLLLSEAPPGAADEVVDAAVTPTVYTRRGIDAFASHPGYEVHLKVNTGMNRVGAAAADSVALARHIGEVGLTLAGVWTHCAVADRPDDPFTVEQSRRFDDVLDALREAGFDPGITHQANSAALLAHPRAHRDLVRAGIAVYGIAPSPEMADVASGLRPAMTLRSEVSFVKRVDAGEAISYGLAHTFAEATTVATVPIGYADGVPRRLSSTGGEVLIGGRRRPIVGVVTMDQLMVDCADDAIRVSDEVILLGEQETERIRPEEWAEKLDTIGYEIVCGISARVPRVHVGTTAEG